MNRVLVFFISSLLALLIGWGIGGYITYNNTIDKVGQIPASPIVVKSVYNKEAHAVIYSVYNPGTVPLTVTNQSFIFKPGKETTQKAYEVANIPVNIILPPLTTAIVRMNLKKGTEKLKQGDIILSTLHYVHPLSNDVYTVSHRFEYTGKPSETPPKEYKKGGK